MRPIGADGPLGATGTQPLGRVAVVDHDHGPGLQPPQGMPQPLPGGELHLDPGSRRQPGSMALGPGRHLRPGRDRDATRLLLPMATASSSHPAATRTATAAGRLSTSSLAMITPRRSPKSHRARPATSTRKPQANALLRRRGHLHRIGGHARDLVEQPGEQRSTSGAAIDHGVEGTNPIALRGNEIAPASPEQRAHLGAGEEVPVRCDRSRPDPKKPADGSYRAISMKRSNRIGPAAAISVAMRSIKDISGQPPATSHQPDAPRVRRSHSLRHRGLPQQTRDLACELLGVAGREIRGRPVPCG